MWQQRIGKHYLVVNLGIIYLENFKAPEITPASQTAPVFPTHAAARKLLFERPFTHLLRSSGLQEQAALQTCSGCRHDCSMSRSRQACTCANRWVSNSTAVSLEQLARSMRLGSGGRKPTCSWNTYLDPGSDFLDISNRFVSFRQKFTKAFIE